VHNVEEWREANKHLFSPPVCNKLMYLSSHRSFFLVRVCECGWVGVGARECVSVGGWVSVRARRTDQHEEKYWRSWPAWPACSAMVAADGMLTAVALHADRARPSEAAPKHLNMRKALLGSCAIDTLNICVVGCVALRPVCMHAWRHAPPCRKRRHSTTPMSTGRNAVHSLYCSSCCERLKVYARTCLIAAELTRNAEWRAHDHRKRNMHSHKHARTRTHTGTGTKRTT
jgi:hypothetical protein